MLTYLDIILRSTSQLKAQHEGDEDNSDSDDFEMEEEEMPLAERIYRQNEAIKAKDLGEKRLLEFWPVRGFFVEFSRFQN